MSRISSRIVALLGALALVAVAAPAQAQQGTVDFTAYGGFYVPTTDLIDTFAGQPVTPTIKQKSAFIFGGRVTGWVTDAVGIEGAFGWALSDVKENTSGGVTENANVWLADLSLLYAFPMQSDAASFFVKAGPTLVGHTGKDFWDGISGRTDIGGTAGVGVRFKVAPMVLIRVDAEDHVFSAKFTEDATGSETDSKLQNDLVFSAGLSIAAGGSR